MKRRPAFRPAGCAGHTLAELLAVLNIMAIMLLLAYPSTAPVNVTALEAVVEKVTEALRFAPVDATQTGASRVVSVDLTNQTVRIDGLKRVPNLPAEETASPVTHPLDKKTDNLAVISPC